MVSNTPKTKNPVGTDVMETPMVALGVLTSPQWQRRRLRGNRMWKAMDPAGYQAWLEAGPNKAEAPAPTQEELQ